MLPLSRSHCRCSGPASNLLHQHFIPFRPLYHPLRTYATPQIKTQKPPRPKPYTSSTSTSTAQIKPPTPSSPRPGSVPISTPNPPPQPVVPLQPIIPTTVSSPINPPSTTHPPPLSLPEKGSSLPLYKYYYRLGKAYALFYKTGLKAIWTNYKSERALGYSNAQPVRIYAAVRDGKLTRADFQLLVRSRRDVTKLPLFMLLWIICGEFTPLVVTFVTGLVPRTIWIPKQVEAARKGVEERRRNVMETAPVKGRLATPIQVIDAMEPETREQMYRFMAQAYGLYSAWWDRYIPSLIPGGVIKRRVRRRIAEIEVDDFAIARDGGVGKIDSEEVVRACEERGIDILGREEKELREELRKYLKWRKSNNIEDAEKGGNNGV